MNIDEAIEHLQSLKRRYGNLQVTDSEDRPVSFDFNDDDPDEEPVIVVS